MPKHKPVQGKSTLPGQLDLDVDASNVGRTLAAIAVDINQRDKLARENIFEIGRLLVEAEKACEHGKWMKWLKAEFGWTNQTARNYMAAHELAERFKTVLNLKVPMRVIYALGHSYIDDPDLPAVIDALSAVKADRDEPMSFNHALEVISDTKLRMEFGDYPAEALRAMGRVRDLPWGEAAIAALKAERPEDDRFYMWHHAQAIVDRVQRAYEAEHQTEAEREAEAEIAAEIEAVAAGDDADDAGGDIDDADDAEAAPAPKVNRRSSMTARDRNARQIFLKDCNDAGIAAERYDGPIDDEVLRACRRAAEAWTKLADKLEAAAQVKAEAA
jgi:Protein of unknown function (DUF3102)